MEDLDEEEALYDSLPRAPLMKTMDSKWVHKKRLKRSHSEEQGAVTDGDVLTDSEPETPTQRFTKSG